MNRSIQGLFHSIPTTYEWANRVLTLGMDALWRRSAARICAAEGGERWLDACCGTGDMSRQLRRLYRHATIVGFDFSLPMLQEAAAHGRVPAALLVGGDVGALPFADEVFDVVTVSFAMRNLSATRQQLLLHLREVHRVLRPRGRFVCVETSQPAHPLVRWAFHTYARVMVGRLGAAVSGCPEPYRYLAASMCSFFGLQELRGTIEEAGFSQVVGRPLMLGVVAIHSARKIGGAHAD